VFSFFNTVRPLYQGGCDAQNMKQEVRNAYIILGWKISEGADLVTDLSVDGEYY